MFSDCPLDSVYIGRSIKYLTSEESKKSPFSGNKYLRTVSITNRETEIYENEFYGCTNLKNISMGEDIANIGNRAFSGCIGLVKFVCGSKVQKIGKNAFSGCSSIMRFISHAIMPPICDLHALDDINKWYEQYRMKLERNNRGKYFMESCEYAVHPLNVLYEMKQQAITL